MVGSNDECLELNGSSGIRALKHIHRWCVCVREDSFAYLPVEFRHDSSINPKDEVAAVAADRPRGGRYRYVRNRNDIIYFER